MHAELQTLVLHARNHMRWRINDNFPMTELLMQCDREKVVNWMLWQDFPLFVREELQARMTLNEKEVRRMSQLSFAPIEIPDEAGESDSESEEGSGDSASEDEDYKPPAPAPKPAKKEKKPTKKDRKPTSPRPSSKSSSGAKSPRPSKKGSSSSSSEKKESRSKSGSSRAKKESRAKSPPPKERSSSSSSSSDKAMRKLEKMSDEEFEQRLKCSRADFERLPRWKQKININAAGLS